MRASIELLRKMGWFGVAAHREPIESADGSGSLILVEARYSGLDLLDPTTWEPSTPPRPVVLGQAA